MLRIRLATAADCDAAGALIAQMAAHYGGLGAGVEANAAARHGYPNDTWSAEVWLPHPGLVPGLTTFGQHTIGQR